MTQRIFKYTMDSPRSSFEIPGPNVLSVGYQDSEIVIWVQVDPDRPVRRRTFEAVNTGNKVPPSGIYVGTVTTHKGFVWHVFEIPPRERR